jgi:hypothetical protein
MRAAARWSAGALALLAGVLLSGGQARGSVIIDPAGDFLPTYTGPRNPGLDVVRADGYFDGSSFYLFAILSGPAANAPPGSSFVWGINTGAGRLSFINGNPSVGQGVFFDSVFLIRPDGTTNNPAVTGFINGNEIGIVVPLALVPSTGAAPENFTWNLWPRSGGGNAAISDFAPNASMAPFTSPEPSTVLTFAVGGLLLFGGWRCRRPAVPAAG